MEKRSMLKTNVLAVALALTVPASYFIGCDTHEGANSEQQQKAQADLNEAEANLEAAKADYNREMENFKREMAERSEANNQAISSLKEAAARQRAEARAAYKARIAELELKNTEMKVKLDEYKGEGNEKWAAFKAEFNHDMDELGRAIKDIGKDNVKQ